MVSVASESDDAPSSAASCEAPSRASSPPLSAASSDASTPPSEGVLLLEQLTHTRARTRTQKKELQEVIEGRSLVSEMDNPIIERCPHEDLIARIEECHKRAVGLAQLRKRPYATDSRGRFNRRHYGVLAQVLSFGRNLLGGLNNDRTCPASLVPPGRVGRDGTVPPVWGMEGWRRRGRSWRGSRNRLRRRGRGLIFVGE